MDFAWAASMMGLLMKCLAKAMDEVFTEKFGDEWFSRFYEEDQAYPSAQRICKCNSKKGRPPQNVRELDFQGYIKLLSFRETYAVCLYEKYPICTSSDETVVNREKKRLTDLLKRLRRDFRNSAFAHVTLEDYLEDEQYGGAQSLYGIEEIAQDIETLARIFRTVTDERGRSYYELIVEYNAKRALGLNREPAVKRYDLNEICAAERFEVSPEQLYRACVTAGMTVHIQQNRMFLETADYAADILRIRERLLHEKTQALAAHKQTNPVFIILTIVAAVALIGVVGWWIATAVRSDAPVDPAVSVSTQGPTSSSQTTNTAKRTTAPSTTSSSAPSSLPASVTEEIQTAIDTHTGSLHATLYIGQTKTLFTSVAANGGTVYSVNPAVASTGSDGSVTGRSRGETFVVCLYPDNTLKGVYKILVL